MTVTATRVGQGLDVHAFAADAAGTLVLGGVEIPEGPALEGHSDADVVLHALTDALLGAAGLGDLGEMAGIDDPATRDAPSAGFVESACVRLGRDGWSIANADLTVVAQRPRLSPHRDRMRARVADLLGLPETAVSLKATTTDGLGAIGRGEGIACLAVVLLLRGEGNRLRL